MKNEQKFMLYDCKNYKDIKKTIENLKNITNEDFDALFPDFLPKPDYVKECEEIYEVLTGGLAIYELKLIATLRNTRPGLWFKFLKLARLEKSAEQKTQELKNEIERLNTCNND